MSVLRLMEGAGGSFLVRVIRSGLSLNGNFYPPAVLRDAVHLFEGARVFAKSDAEHLAGQGKDVRGLIGRLRNPVFVENDGGEIHATLDVLTTAGDFAARLKEAVERNMSDIFGLSIDALAESERGGRGENIVKRFQAVNSVDLIVEPGAGGEILQLLEAKKRNFEAMDETQAPVETPETPPEAPAGLSDVQKLIKAKAEEKAGGTLNVFKFDSAADGDGTNIITIDDAGKYWMWDYNIDPVTGEITVADPVEAVASFAPAMSGEAPAEAPVEEIPIVAVTEAKGGKPGKPGGKPKPKVTGMGSVRITESAADKAQKMMQAVFERKFSLLEAYRQITGDMRVSGDFRNADKRRLREAAGRITESVDSSTWSNILLDSMEKKMIAEYRDADMYGMWRELADVIPVANFKTQNRVRWGGYGAPSLVAEGYPYPLVSSPTDENITYAVKKYGGIEQVTLEMVRNDDLSQFSRIPQKMARGAARALGKFVFDFLKDNPTLWDSVALFHGTHANLGSTALDATTLAAGRLAMLKQAEKDTSERLNIPPKWLIVPPDLEETAFNLFRRTTNNDTDFVETLQMQVIPVWYWTDTNNWYLAADKADIPLIEMGFLDGREEPELLIADQPTSGSMFTNDVIQIKLRHIYGGNVLDYRGLYGAIVT